MVNEIINNMRNLLYAYREHLKYKELFRNLWMSFVSILGRWWKINQNIIDICPLHPKNHGYLITTNIS